MSVNKYTKPRREPYPWERQQQAQRTDTGNLDYWGILEEKIRLLKEYGRDPQYLQWRDAVFEQESYSTKGGR